MKKTVAFLTFFVGGSLLLFTLGLLGCNVRDYIFVYNRLELRIQQASSGIEPVDLASGDTCNYINHGFQLDMGIQVIVHHQQPNLGNSAFALQVAEPSYINAEKITDISIVPLYNYNAGHPAGEDISDICLFNIGAPFYGGISPLSKDEVIGYLNPLSGTYDNAYVSKVNFNINQAPSSPGLQQFAIEIRTEGQSVIRDTSVVFVFRP